MKSLLLDVFLHYNSSFSCRCNYFHNIFLKRRPLSRNSCQSRNYAAVSSHSSLQSTQRHSQMYAERHLYLSPVKCHLLATWISLQAIIYVSNSSSGRTYAMWIFWVVSYFTNLPPLFLPPLCLHRPKNPVLGKETFTEELLWKMCLFGCIDEKQLRNYYYWRIKDFMDCSGCSAFSWTHKPAGVCAHVFLGVIKE